MTSRRHHEQPSASGTSQKPVFQRWLPQTRNDSREEIPHQKTGTDHKSNADQGVNARRTSGERPRRPSSRGYRTDTPTTNYDNAAPSHSIRQTTQVRESSTIRTHATHTLHAVTSTQGAPAPQDRIPSRRHRPRTDPVSDPRFFHVHKNTSAESSPQSLHDRIPNVDDYGQRAGVGPSQGVQTKTWIHGTSSPKHRPLKETTDKAPETANHGNSRGRSSRHRERAAVTDSEMFKENTNDRGRSDRRGERDGVKAAADDETGVEKTKDRTDRHRKREEGRAGAEALTRHGKPTERTERPRDREADGGGGKYPQKTTQPEKHQRVSKTPEVQLPLHEEHKRTTSTRQMNESQVQNRASLTHATRQKLPSSDGPDADSTRQKLPDLSNRRHRHVATAPQPSTKSQQHYNDGASAPGPSLGSTYAQPSSLTESATTHPPTSSQPQSGRESVPPTPRVMPVYLPAKEAKPKKSHRDRAQSIYAETGQSSSDNERIARHEHRHRNILRGQYHPEPAPAIAEHVQFVPVSRPSTRQGDTAREVNGIVPRQRDSPKWRPPDPRADLTSVAPVQAQATLPTAMERSDHAMAAPQRVNVRAASGPSIVEAQPSTAKPEAQQRPQLDFYSRQTNPGQTQWLSQLADPCKGSTQWISSTSPHPAAYQATAQSLGASSKALHYAMKYPSADSSNLQPPTHTAQTHSRSVSHPFDATGSRHLSASMEKDHRVLDAQTQPATTIPPSRMTSVASRQIAHPPQPSGHLERKPNGLHASQSATCDTGSPPIGSTIEAHSLAAPSYCTSSTQNALRTLSVKPKGDALRRQDSIPPMLEKAVPRQASPKKADLYSGLPGIDAGIPRSSPRRRAESLLQPSEKVSPPSKLRELRSSDRVTPSASTLPRSFLAPVMPAHAVPQMYVPPRVVAVSASGATKTEEPPSATSAIGGGVPFEGFNSRHTKSASGETKALGQETSQHRVPGHEIPRFFELDPTPRTVKLAGTKGVELVEIHSTPPSKQVAIDRITISDKAHAPEGNFNDHPKSSPPDMISNVKELKPAPQMPFSDTKAKCHDPEASKAPHSLPLAPPKELKPSAPQPSSKSSGPPSGVSQQHCFASLSFPAGGGPPPRFPFNEDAQGQLFSQTDEPPTRKPSLIPTQVLTAPVPVVVMRAIPQIDASTVTAVFKEHAEGARSSAHPHVDPRAYPTLAPAQPIATTQTPSDVLEHEGGSIPPQLNTHRGSKVDTAYAQEWAGVTQHNQLAAAAPPQVQAPDADGPLLHPPAPHSVTYAALGRSPRSSDPILPQPTHAKPSHQRVRSSSASIPASLQSKSGLKGPYIESLDAPDSALDLDGKSLAHPSERHVETLGKPSQHPFGDQPFAVAAISQNTADLWSSSRAPPLASQVPQSSIPPQRATATAIGVAVLQPTAGLQIDPQEHLSSTHGLTEDDVKVFKGPSHQLGLGVTSVQDTKETAELDDAPNFPLASMAPSSRRRSNSLKRNQIPVNSSAASRLSSLGPATCPPSILHADVVLNAEQSAMAASRLHAIVGEPQTRPYTKAMDQSSVRLTQPLRQVHPSNAPPRPLAPPLESHHATLHPSQPSLPSIHTPHNNGGMCESAAPSNSPLLAHRQPLHATYALASPQQPRHESWSHPHPTMTSLASEAQTDAPAVGSIARSSQPQPSGGSLPSTTFYSSCSAPDSTTGPYRYPHVQLQSSNIEGATLTFQPQGSLGSNMYCNIDVPPTNSALRPTETQMHEIIASATLPHNSLPLQPQVTASTASIPFASGNRIPYSSQYDSAAVAYGQPPLLATTSQGHIYSQSHMAVNDPTLSNPSDPQRVSYIPSVVLPDKEGPSASTASRRRSQTVVVTREMPPDSSSSVLLYPSVSQPSHQHSTLSASVPVAHEPSNRVHHKHSLSLHTSTFTSDPAPQPRLLHPTIRQLSLVSMPPAPPDSDKSQASRPPGHAGPAVPYPYTAAPEVMSTASPSRVQVSGHPSTPIRHRISKLPSSPSVDSILHTPSSIAPSIQPRSSSRASAQQPQEAPKRRMSFMGIFKSKTAANQGTSQPAQTKVAERPPSRLTRSSSKSGDSITKAQPAKLSKPRPAQTPHPARTAATLPPAQLSAGPPPAQAMPTPPARAAPTYYPAQAAPAPPLAPAQSAPAPPLAPAQSAPVPFPEVNELVPISTEGLKSLSAFRFLSAHHRRRRTVSAASVEAIDGTPAHTVIGSPPPSTISPLLPYEVPPLRDPYEATQEWRNVTEADQTVRGTRRRRTPGVVFDVAEPTPRRHPTLSQIYGGQVGP